MIIIFLQIKKMCQLNTMIIGKDTMNVWSMKDTMNTMMVGVGVAGLNET